MGAGCKLVLLSRAPSTSTKVKVGSQAWEGRRLWWILGGVEKGLQCCLHTDVGNALGAASTKGSLYNCEVKVGAGAGAGNFRITNRAVVAFSRGIRGLQCRCWCHQGPLLHLQGQGEITNLGGAKFVVDSFG